MTDKTTSEVLNLAADYLQEYGWQQGDLGRPAGPRCLMGGICSGAEADDINSINFKVHVRAASRVQDYLNDEQPAVWNDEPGRTATEVIEVLRATAVIEAAWESKPAEVSA